MTREEMDMVYPMGELPEFYDCIERAWGRKFLTREVVLTGKQIYHMNFEEPHHPLSYDQYGHHIPEILRNPDYIIEGSRGCCLILKEIGEDYFTLVLWIKPTEEPASYKNSVHTFYRMGRAKWNQFIRNKKILYKRV